MVLHIILFTHVDCDNLQSCPSVDVCRIERRSPVVAKLPRAHHRWNLKQQNVDMAPGNRRQGAVNHYIGGM